MDRLRNEPVALAALARVAGMLTARYGLQLSVDEIIGLLVAVEVVVGYVTRARVSPVP